MGLIEVNYEQKPEWKVGTRGCHLIVEARRMRVGCHLMVEARSFEFWCNLMLEARRHDGWVPFDAMVKAGGLRVKGVMVTG